MKKRDLLHSAAFSVFSCVVAHLALGDTDVYAQQRSVNGPNVTRTAAVSKVEESSSIFVKAAAENSKLRNSLQWTFGGKAQAGWNIYAPLIAHTIGTDEGPDSAGFASAISKWQRSKGLSASGVVDRETIESFTKFWQSRRLGRSGLSGSDQLLSAISAEFWDPSRPRDLQQVERETYAAYKRMLAAAVKDLGPGITGGRFLKIISSYRSPDYQETLRKREPNAGRAALAKNSPHSTGHALDIFVGGEPVSTKDPNRLLQVQTPAYRWLVKNAEKFGFYPYFYEPWHWEYVPAR